MLSTRALIQIVAQAQTAALGQVANQLNQIAAAGRNMGGGGAGVAAQTAGLNAMGTAAKQAQGNVLDLNSALQMAAAAAPFVLAGQQLNKATDTAMTFETAMRGINTVTRRSEPEFAAMTAQVLDLGGTMDVGGQSSTQLADSLNEIFQANIGTNKRLTWAENLNQALEVAKIAARGAAAGMTDVKTSADGLTSVLNAYGMVNAPIDQVSHVMDTMFETVVQGKITFQELAGEIGYVAQSAAVSGASFDELGAFIAVLTDRGVPAASVMRSLNQLFSEMQGPGDDAKEAMAGMSAAMGDASLTFDLTKVKAMGFIPWLQNVGKAAVEMAARTGKDPAEILKTIIPSIYAMRAALAVATGDEHALDDALQSMRNSSELVDGEFKGLSATEVALGERAKTARFSLNQLGAMMEKVYIIIGTPIIAQIADWTKGLSGLLDMITSTNPQLLEMAGSVLAGVAAIGSILGVVAALTFAMGPLKAAFWGLINLFKLQLIPLLFGPFGLAIAGVLALFALLNTNWFGTVKEGTKLTQLMDALGDAMGILSGSAPSAGAALRLAFGDAAEGIANFLAKVRDTITAIGEIFQILSGADPNAGAALRKVFGDDTAENISNMTASIREFFKAFGETVNPPTSATSAIEDPTSPEYAANVGKTATTLTTVVDRLDAHTRGVLAIIPDPARVKSLADNLIAAANAGRDLANDMHRFVDKLNEATHSGVWKFLFGDDTKPKYNSAGQPIDSSGKVIPGPAKPKPKSELGGQLGAPDLEHPELLGSILGGTVLAGLGIKLIGALESAFTAGMPGLTSTVSTSFQTAATTGIRTAAPGVGRVVATEVSSSVVTGLAPLLGPALAVAFAAAMVALAGYEVASVAGEIRDNWEPVRKAVHDGTIKANAGIAEELLVRLVQWGDIFDRVGTTVNGWLNPVPYTPPVPDRAPGGREGPEVIPGTGPVALGTSAVEDVNSPEYAALIATVSAATVEHLTTRAGERGGLPSVEAQAYSEMLAKNATDLSAQVEAFRLANMTPRTVQAEINVNLRGATAAVTDTDALVPVVAGALASVADNLRIQIRAN